MRALKILLTLLVIATAGSLIYLVYGTQAEIHCSVETAPASEYESVFNTVVEAVRYGTAAQIIEQDIGNVSGYELVNLTVTVKNPGAIQMEWMTCSYVPAEGDAAVYAVTELPEDIAPRGEISFIIQYLRHTGTAQIGSFDLTYYVAGYEIIKTVQP